MTATQKEAPTFLVRKERLDAKAIFVVRVRFLPHFQIGHQVQWRIVSAMPCRHKRSGSDVLRGEEDIGEFADVSTFHTEPSKRVSPLLVCVFDAGVFGQTAHRVPALGFYGTQQSAAIELALAEKDDRTLRGQEGFDLCEKFLVESIAEMSFGSGDNEPTQRQGAFFINDTHHQRHTPAPVAHRVDERAVSEHRAENRFWVRCSQ